METLNTGDVADGDATLAGTAAERPLPSSPRVPSPPAAPPSLFARLVRGSGLLLLLGAAVQFVALYLPWEHIVEFNSSVPGNHVAVDLPVYSFLMPNPGLLYAELLFGSTITRAAVAQTTWDVFWHTALPTLGLLLALAILAWRHAAVRWPLALLYALWLVVTSAMAVNFARTLAGVRNGALRFDPNAAPTLWQRLTGTSITIAGSPPSFAYGYWLFAAATLASWLALALIVRTLLLSKRNDAPVPEQAAGHVRPLAPALVSLGAVVWLAGLLILPLAAVDCAHPLIPNARIDAVQCRLTDNVYSFQAVAFWLVVKQPLSARPIPDGEELGVLEYFRDFTLPILAMAAIPLALATVWRPYPTRGRAAGLSAWGALVVGETAFLLWMLAYLTSFRSTPNIWLTFPFIVGPGAFALSVGGLLALAGLALYWRGTLHSTSGIPTAR